MKKEIQRKLIERKCDECFAFKEGCMVPHTDDNCIGCKRFRR